MRYLPVPLCFRLYPGSSSLKVSGVSACPARLLPVPGLPGKQTQLPGPERGLPHAAVPWRAWLHLLDISLFCLSHRPLTRKPCSTL